MTAVLEDHAAVISRGLEVLALVNSCDFQWPARGAQIHLCRAFLGYDLDLYADILGGREKPEDACPETAEYPDPLREALTRVAADVAACTGDLIQTVTELCETETAVLVSGKGGPS